MLTSTPNNASMLPRDSAATARLEELHRLITTGLGFLLQPAVKTALTSQSDPQRRVRIADVACGTGIWLSQVVHQLGLQIPTEGDGFDVSIHQTSEKASPSAHGLRFHTLDIASPDPIPAEFVGQFDVVAVRLLHISLRNDQWDKTMQNLVSFLKPNGYLVWTDWDPLTARIAATKPGAHDAALRELFRCFSDMLRDRQVGITYRIPNIMATYGLVDIDSDIYPIPPSFDFTKNLAEGALALLEHEGSFDTVEMEDLRPRVERELNAEGSLLWYDLWCHIGKKKA